MQNFTESTKDALSRSREEIEQKITAAQQATDLSVRDNTLAEALRMTATLLEQHPNSGYNAFKNVLAAARSPSPLPATTQAAIDCYKSYISNGKGHHHIDMADLLAGHTTFRFSERTAVINALIDTLPAMASVLKNSAIPHLTRQVTDLAMDDQELFAKAVSASWATVHRLAPDNLHIAHEIIYTLYGTAKRFHTEERDNGLEEYIAGGRLAIQDIVKNNQSFAIVAAEAIEIATREILYGKKHGLYSHIASNREEMFQKNYCTPEFVRIGALQQHSGRRPNQDNRWLFPVKSGEEVAVVTLVRRGFDDAAPDDDSRLGEHDKDVLKNARKQFELAVKGKIEVVEAAKRVGSTLGHFNMDAYNKV